MPRRSIFVLIALMGFAPAAQAAPTAQQRCESAIELASAKYAQCRLNAESKYSKTLDGAKRTAALAKCSTNLGTAFTKVTDKYGGACTATEPSSAFATYLNQCSDDATAAAGGAALPDYAGDLAACEACGNGTVDAGEACDGSDLSGATCATQGFAGGTLGCAAGCTLDTSGCWATRWANNGDGTATDRTTGLQWELKTDDNATVHDKDNLYDWSATFEGATPDGTAFTSFLSTLNGGATGIGNCTDSGGGFAGHCDWRLPTLAELQGIVDLSAPGCGGGAPCSTIPGVTVPFSYWSSSTYTFDPPYAWFVDFFDGDVFATSKSLHYYVRAVRGGS